MRVRLPVISDLYANVWSGMDVSFQDRPTGACESHECALKLPFAELRLHAQRRCLLGSSYVGLWHIADVRLAAPEGLLTNGLPTLAAEGLFSGRKPTVSESVLKVG